MSALAVPERALERDTAELVRKHRCEVHRNMRLQLIRSFRRSVASSVGVEPRERTAASNRANPYEKRGNGTCPDE